jgi:shikimate dehydrogenase
MLVQFTGITTLLGLIGDPVAQARTPGMANQLLDDRGKLGQFVLVPMHVSPIELPAFISGIRRMQNFGGAVVTMPHKVHMAALIDELTPEAQLVQAVNVIRRTTDGKLIGTTLDGEGFVEGLLSSGHVVEGKNCVLVGAGGAASAIAFALAKNGCRSLHLLNRTTRRAEALAQRLRKVFPKLSIGTVLPCDDAIDIAINGTCLGMNPGDELPMSEALVSRSKLVAECVIAPEVTALLKVARRNGCHVHTGIPMLFAQINMMLKFMGVE